MLVVVQNCSAGWMPMEHLFISQPPLNSRQQISAPLVIEGNLFPRPSSRTVDSMAVPFLDTSALVKRYVTETGSPWITALTDITAQKDCWISSITPVELLAALSIRVRTGSITLPLAQQTEQRFRLELSTHFQIITLIPVILNRAMGLVTAHPLRAYDAVQLAAAQYLNSQYTSLGLSPVIMVSADHNLNQAAIAEGLAIDNPNQHP
jgi:uncharacterized protein